MVAQGRILLTLVAPNQYLLMVGLKDIIKLTGTPSGGTIHTINGGEGDDMITGNVGENRWRQ